MPDVSIRTQRPDSPADRSAVRDLTALAFGEEGEKVSHLVEALQHSDAYAGLSYIAEKERRVVGHTMLTRSWVDAPKALVEVQVLSPLSVHPDYQGHGIGQTLVRHALEAAEEADAPAVFLEGDPGYYRQLGFERASERGFARPSVRIPDEAFQVVTLPTFEDWMSGAVVYCDRFWALDCVGLR